MNQDQESGDVGTSATEFNRGYQELFDDTVRVVAKTIVANMNKQIKLHSETPFLLDVKDLLPEGINTNLMNYDFIVYFNVEREGDKKRHALFDAIWKEVRSRFDGWDITYDYEYSTGTENRAKLWMESNFDPQPVVTVDEFMDAWKTEFDKMIQFFVADIKEGINAASGKMSLENRDICIDGIRYDSRLILTPSEGRDVFEEVEKELKQSGWSIHAYCKKESLTNMLYPYRIYEVTVKPSAQGDVS